MNRMKLILLVTVLPATVAVGFVLAPSNIDSTDKWSWGGNVGWMNWRDANGSDDGVVVNSDHLSGYIWCENVGWVNVGDGGGPHTNTDNTNFGVNILGGGNLEGYAWAENVGWINFDTSGTSDPARYDSGASRFRGYAWGENIGWINLDDATHFVGVSGSCVEDGDCDDGTVCTWDQCTGGSCTFTPNTYGDVDHNGTISIFDLFCILNGFGGEFPNCTFEDDDLTGSGNQPEHCGPNGTINIFDLFAVLNAFGGVDPCCDGLP